MKSQILFRNEFLDNPHGLEEVSEEIQTVFIKEEIIDAPSPEIKIVQRPLKTVKPEMYLEWSDDDQSCTKYDNDDELFEILTVIEVVEDDGTPINIKSEKMEVDVETEVKENLEDTDSEPDLVNFDEIEPTIVQKPKKLTKLEKEQAKLAKLEICYICGKSFKIKILEYHLNWHNDVRPYPCKFDGCTKMFISPAQERTHRNRHFEPKHVCTICGNKFHNG